MELDPFVTGLEAEDEVAVGGPTAEGVMAMQVMGLVGVGTGTLWTGKGLDTKGAGRSTEEEADTEEEAAFGGASAQVWASIIPAVGTAGAFSPHTTCM